MDKLRGIKNSDDDDFIYSQPCICKQFESEEGKERNGEERERDLRKRSIEIKWSFLYKNCSLTSTAINDGDQIYKHLCIPSNDFIFHQ